MNVTVINSLLWKILAYNWSESWLSYLVFTVCSTSESFCTSLRNLHFLSKKSMKIWFLHQKVLSGVLSTWVEWLCHHFFYTAVYLCKRTMQNKHRLELADYEAENLARLQKMFSRKWEFIYLQAEAQVK